MKYTDMSRYEILYDLPEGEYRPAEVGGIRTKTIRAGEFLEVECYPLTRVGSRAEAEARERHRQRACQEALNRRNAEKRVRRLICANFTTEDYVLTLTWDYGAIDRNTMSYADAENLWDSLGLPIDEDDARRELKNYFRRVKNRMQRLGQAPKDFKHLYVLEPTHIPRHEDREPLYPHYHFHCVMHAPGLSRDALEELWPQGRAQCHRLSFGKDGEGPGGIASYLTKQHSTEAIDAEGRRLRRWGHSKNLIEPTVTVSDRRISRARAARIAEDVRRDGRAILEAVYEKYRCIEPPTVRYSDYVAGAYICARLRKIADMPPLERHGARLAAQPRHHGSAYKSRGKPRAARSRS